MRLGNPLLALAEESLTSYVLMQDFLDGERKRGLRMSQSLDRRITILNDCTKLLTMTSRLEDCGKRYMQLNLMLSLHLATTRFLLSVEKEESQTIEEVYYSHLMEYLRSSLPSIRLTLLEVTEELTRMENLSVKMQGKEYSNTPTER